MFPNRKISPAWLSLADCLNRLGKADESVLIRDFASTLPDVPMIPIVIVLGGILAGLVILTSTLPLSPALADQISRSAMLCVLLIALPALQLRSLILALCRQLPAPDPGVHVFFARTDTKKSEPVSVTVPFAASARSPPSAAEASPNRPKVPMPSDLPVIAAGSAVSP